MRTSPIPLKLLMPVAIVITIVLSIWLLKATKPEAKKRPPPSGPSINVEVSTVKAASFSPQILSFGMVAPRVNSKLVAQVSGRIEYMSEQFRDGGFFKKGDLLLKIEATDYDIQVEIAKANLAQAERTLAEEEAQAEQARIDWERLGQDSEPSPLVLRQPQLAAAKANLQSLAAQLKQAELNLARTQIHAPFDGRVLSTSIDLGQVAANNTVLGDIYATDAIEVRLPIKNSEIALLHLPEQYSHTGDSNTVHHTPVDIISELGGVATWRGQLVRTASTIDDTSRQLYVVARINDPFGKKAEGRFPLKIGQYVTAKIQGITLENAITIPNHAIYQGSYVYTYKEGAVYRQDISIQWQNGDIAIIDQGLSDGQQLVVSPLGQIASGTPVKAMGDNLPQQTAHNKPAARDMPIEQWLQRIPPPIRDRLSKKAEQEGRPLHDVAEEARAQRMTQGAKP